MLSLLTIGLLAALGVQLFFYGKFFRRPFRQQVLQPGPSDRPVSVIVCFHNEEAALARCIEAILAQDYPDFELLLVDDNSTDRSAAIVRGYPDGRLRLLRAGPTRLGKKDALAHGIASARHDLLLLTDADCVPASREWIRRMTLPLQRGAELALGLSPYAGGRSLLHRWQRFEACYTAIQYTGFAGQGEVYMGVGRNLAYTRFFWDSAGGFAAHADLPGGDDDLLVSGSALAETSRTVVNDAAWTISAPSDDWRTYLRQKVRHQSVGGRYPARIKRWLLVLAASHGLFFLLLLVALLRGEYVLAFITYVWRAIYVLGAYLEPRVRRFQRVGSGTDKNPAPIWQLLVFDALFAGFYVFLALATLRSPSRQW